MAIFLAITLPHLDQGDFRTDTAWYSAIGVQAWRSGSWAEFWSPLAEPGQPYFNKPPLALWIHGLPLWALGTDLWIARIGSVLAGAITIVLTVRLARLRASPLGAATAGCVLALTYEFFRRTKEVSLDLWHTTFLIAALICMASAVLGRSSGPTSNLRTNGSWLFGGAMVGLALMCKPMQALLAIPIVAAWAFIVSAPSLRLRVVIGTKLALLAALAVAGPWHLSMYLIHGEEFTERLFGGEIGDRLTGSMVQFDVESQRPTFYFEQLARTYWPWLAAVSLSFWLLIHERRTTESSVALPPPLSTLNALVPGRWSIVVLAILWTCVWLAALSIFPDRRDRYAIVLWPALAIVSASLVDSRWFMRDRDRRSRHALMRTLRAAPALAVVAGGLFAILPVRVQRGVDPQWPALFEFLRNEEFADRSIHAGGIHGNMSARLYLQLGHWPLKIPNPESLAAGDLLLYHVKGSQGPGPGETTLFKERDVWLTRLDDPPWRPVSREAAWE